MLNKTQSVPSLQGVLRTGKSALGRKTLSLLTLLLLTVTVNSQSVLTLGSGTSMGVLTGADLCANIITGTGILYGGGRICGGLVAIDPISSAELPTTFEMNQNYPNPFNPKTNIKIQMPNSGFVKLTVFDISGKEVAVLVNQGLKTGTYNVDFDAGNLGSGVYFYKIETNGFSDVKKMVLVK